MKSKNSERCRRDSYTAAPPADAPIARPGVRVDLAVTGRATAGWEPALVDLAAVWALVLGLAFCPLY